MAEVIKLVISMGMLLNDNQWSLIHSWIVSLNTFLFIHLHFKVIKREIIHKPIELMKMSVPSITCQLNIQLLVYLECLDAIQNNLDFIALSNLNAGVYQVHINGKLYYYVNFR